MPLKGIVTGGEGSPMTRGSFRVPWIQPEGATGAFMHEATIIDVNLQDWTVDVRTQFDRRFFLNIQVMTPYCHPNNGEGIYAFPDLGARCILAIPSDGPPPIVIGFIMPVTSIGDVGTDDAPFGTTPATGVDAQSGKAIAFSGATYGGGRPRPKPGDIYMKGRDGNFCILHRGGVLQIGSTALAQRLFIPINNIVTDISQNYHHYNTGGAINWFVDPGDSKDNSPTTYKQTFRLHAPDKKATVRVSIGTIKDPVGLDPRDVGATEVINEKIGKEAPIIYEVVIAPEDIESDDGTLTSTTRGSATLQFAFDKNGGAYLWAAGSVVFATKKKLVIRADQDISVSTKKALQLHGEESGRISTSGTLELIGKIVKIGPGTDRAAFKGCPVLVSIPPAGLIVLVAGTPTPVGTKTDPTGLLPITLLGAISEGRANVLI